MITIILMSIKTILFDFDYTLADSSKGVFECVNYALNRMSFPEQSFTDICRTIGLSLAKTYSSLTNRDDPKEVEAFKDLFVERADQVMAELTNIYDSVPQTIPELKSRGISLGIVSTKFRYRISGILKREKLLRYFDVIIGGEDVGSHKPDPEGLMMALSELSTSPLNCLYVGDSLVDGELTKRANVKFAAVCSGTTKYSEFLKYNPYIICDSVKQLPELLLNNV